MLIRAYGVLIRRDVWTHFVNWIEITRRRRGWRRERERERERKKGKESNKEKMRERRAREKERKSARK